MTGNRTVHIAAPSIVLLLNDHLDIIDMKRVRQSYRPPPHVTSVHEMTATADGLPSIDGDTFETDGLGCIRLMSRIIDERPDANERVHRSQFEALFAGNPADALVATLRIASGVDSTAPGESGYYCAQQWRHHPEEMAALALWGSLQ